MNKEKIRISIVNYTNTLPFRWALKRSKLADRIDLQEDIPSICAQKLKYGQVDIALVPVALLAELPEYHILTEHCIGADGKVDSVKLYSHVPLNGIREIVLDYQSRSSVALTRILCREHWHISPQFRDALPGFEKEISGDSAAVVIGDRTFRMNGKYPYEFDLSQEWKKMTGLPFVFAVWVSVHPQENDFLTTFNSVLGEGLKEIKQAIGAEHWSGEMSKEKVEDYLVNRISYGLSAEKRKGMELFLGKLRKP